MGKLSIVDGPRRRGGPELEERRIVPADREGETNLVPEVSDGLASDTLDLSVVVPVRNAERLLDDCLATIVR